MNWRTAIGVLLLIIPFLAFAQLKQRNMRLEVLKHNHIGREYISKAEDQSTTYLKYLGSLRTKKGIRYKIINSVWIWGQSHRATNRILIFNERNKYLGNYRLTIIDDLPSFIKDNKLDFDNGIPHEFFRKCNGDKGDVYTFDKE